MKSKPTLQAENTQLRADNSAYQSQISEMQAKIQRLESTNEALLAEAVEFEKLVTQAESEKLTVTQTATQIVANAGVPLEELPAQESEPSDFDSRFTAAKEAGPTALSKFMTENAAEVTRRLS